MGAGPGAGPGAVLRAMQRGGAFDAERGAAVAALDGDAGLGGELRRLAEGSRALAGARERAAAGPAGRAEQRAAMEAVLREVQERALEEVSRRAWAHLGEQWGRLELEVGRLARAEALQESRQAGTRAARGGARGG